MTEENMLKSMVDSTGLNSEDVQNIIEMRNDLIDKLSEKVEESSEKFNKVRNEVIKVVPDIISHSEKLEHETEDGVSEMLKEAKGKLYDTANDVNCAFSGVINDLTMFSGESDQRASEILGDIKDRIERFSDDIGRTTFETDSGLEELEKIKGGTENVLDVTTKENELIGNVDEIVSEISVGFGEEAIRKGLEEVVNKIYPFAKSAEGTVSETVDTCEKFDSEISEKTTVEVEEEGEKMGKLRKETFGNFQRLKEEVNNKVADVENSAGEKLQGFKEGIDEKINEINMVSDVKDIIYGLDDREKPIVGMSDVCAREDNEDLKEDKFSEEISAPAEVDFLSAANIDHLKSNTSNKDTKKVEEIASKSEDSKETQAIKTIIPPGKDVPEQVGILSESGVYYDDYDALKVKIEEIAITKQKDTVNDKADEVNKLFEEAHSISKKLKEWETGGDVADQQEMQRKEIHDITTDLNESSMAIGDSKSETQFTKNEERKLSSVSQQFPLISEHIKFQDEHNETTDRLQEELVVSSANEIGPPLVQHSEITESLMVASERIEKQQSSEPTSELCFVAEKSFTANEKGTEHEIKLIAIAPQPETNVNLFTDQPSAAEDALKFSAAPTVLENALQSSIPTKSNDQDEIVTGAVIDHIQEKTESKHESAKTSFVNRSGQPDRAASLSVSLRSPVLPPKNAPPPVPPKKKSIEMILAEEAKAMGQQHSLRGFETLTERTVSPGMGKDELGSNDKEEQNVEIPQKSESQMTNTTALTQIQTIETQKTRECPILSAAEIKPEAAHEKDKMDTMKSKISDGQQQQSRRCTII
ncbi:Uncharacterized protein BM_BM10580 [Brugia malayi]|uniref:Uncharacterized protein n=1 Tax=Brugia malayi TaxID=6279 RepID=A0A4E9FNU4_BRUMA|nr:Uncharacterized protein BM_BM10580 [Brugia malayi]VIO98674.1 Uncharacterized protein BM_BM10580 [Brugia malayi]